MSESNEDNEIRQVQPAGSIESVQPVGQAGQAQPVQESPQVQENPRVQESPQVRETPQVQEHPAAPAVPPFQNPDAIPAAAPAVAPAVADAAADAPAALAGLPAEAAAEMLPDTGRRPRRHIKTRTIFIGAVLLGVLGGVGTGYEVQSGRQPTALPPLAAPAPVYAPVGIYAGVNPAPLPTGQDDASITDGDLTKVLLPTPSGANADGSWDHQYIGIVDEAYLCEDQVRCFTNDETGALRAVADTEWTTSSGYSEEIRIYRFAPGRESDASTLENTYTDSLTAPPGIDEVDLFTDTYGNHVDYAFARHGDLAVICWVSSPTNVPDPSMIDTLITQQMARL